MARSQHLEQALTETLAVLHSFVGTGPNTGDLRGYDITMFEDNIREVRIMDEEEVAAGESGVEIEVSELHCEFRSLEPDNAVQELAEIFALACYCRNDSIE